MTNLSLVASNAFDRDPRKLAYLYPKMPVIRYKEKTEHYYRLMAIKAAEDAAKAAGALLIPASCLNHRRRDPQRRLMLHGRNYYVMPIDDLTDLEIAKYKLLCAEQQEAESLCLSK